MNTTHTATAIRAAVLGVSVSRTWEGSNELTVRATITEAAFREASRRAHDRVDGLRALGGEQDEDGEYVYLEIYDRVAGRTLWLCVSEHSTTGYVILQHVHNYDGLDYTRELEEPTLDDRLRFAASLRRLVG